MIPVLQTEEQSGKERDKLGDERGQSRASNAHMKHRHKQQIQHNIGSGGCNDEIEGHLGVAYSSKQGRQCIVAKNRQQANGADLQIDGGFREGGGLQQNKQGL